MSNAWQRASELAKKYSRKKNTFIRLTDDGSRIVVAFLGEPYVRELHWNGERSRDCEGAGCPYCYGGLRPQMRVMFNAYVPAENAVRIIEGGVRWFKDVLKVRDKFGTDKWLFEIERHGNPGDLGTTYSVLPERPITPRLSQKIAAARLRDLSRYARRGSYLHQLVDLRDGA